nr:ribosomal protein L11 [Microheliella maris]BDN85883.1 ribosomal protein L11 [Microheliella maris]
MKKYPSSSLKLRIKVSDIQTSPTLAPVLGQHGINIRDFKQSLSDKAKIYSSESTLIVKIKVFKDKSYEIYLKQPSISQIIKEISAKNHNIILFEHIYELALLRKNDYPYLSTSALCNTIYSNLKSFKNIKIK